MIMAQTRNVRRLVYMIACCALGFVATGCRKPPDNRVKIAYIGLTCEAPIFVAHERGYFEEEGLDAELVKTDWDGLRQGLGLGRFDANHTLIMYLLKPIEGDLDVKITGGIHTGCLRLQVARDSAIKSPAQLRGKRIGIPTHVGSPPHLFAARVLMANGVHPDPDKKEVTWIPYPPDVLGKALEQGNIDAVASADPIGMILLDQGLVRTLADQALDKPYCDEYCCVVAVSGNLARERPEAAAKITRAIFKAAKWVDANPTAAAHLAVDTKKVVVEAEINAQALATLKYDPGVARCRQSIGQAAKEMVQAGLLKPNTDPEQLTARAWLDLDGVTDEWIKGLKVEHVAGGGRPPPLFPGAFALMCKGRNVGGCCD